MNRIRTVILIALLSCCVCGGTTIVQAGPPTTQASAVAPGADDLSNLSLEDLMNVEVTSVSKKKQSIADAPAAVTVISQDDIARSGFSEIPDLLRLVPGMDVARLNNSAWGISARGLNFQFSDKLLVLQDGRTVYNQLFGGVYWEAVDYILPDLERIEVIRGPGATLWGANAVNGVVNIISKDARDTQGLLVDTRGSFDGESNLGVRYGGQLDTDTYYRVYGKARYFDDLPLANGDGSGDEWKSLKGGFRLDKYSSDNDKFTLQGDTGTDPARLNEPQPTFIPPFIQDKRLQPTDTGGNLLARWNHRVDDTSDFSLQLYYDYFHVEDGFAYNQNTFDLDFQDRFTIGTRHEITWGLGYRFINGEFAPNDIFHFQPTKNDNLYSAFVQDTISLAPDRWFFTLGSKFEHNDYTGFEIEPSARLMWTPDKQNTFWGAVSRAVRTPSRTDHDIDLVLSRFQQPVGGGATIPGEAVLMGNPDSESEAMIAYELGYRLQPVKQVSFDIATFYNNYDHLRSAQTQAPEPGVPLIVPVGIGNKFHGDTWGGELGSTVQVTRQWRLSGSYSLLESAFNTNQGATGTFRPLDAVKSAPENQFQLHSYLDITRNIQLNASLYYVARLPEYDIPSYLSTDLNVTWEIREGASLQVGVLNLFDDRHPEFGGFAATTPSEVPRTVYAQLSWKF